MFSFALLDLNSFALVPTGTPLNVEVESTDQHTLRVTWKVNQAIMAKTYLRKSKTLPIYLFMKTLLF